MRWVHFFSAASNYIQSAGVFLGYRMAYEWNDLRRFSDQSVCKLLVEGDEVSNINVAVVLF
jgi:hypothetical protein